MVSRSNHSWVHVHSHCRLPPSIPVFFFSCDCRSLCPLGSSALMAPTVFVTHLFVLSLPSPCPFCIKFPSFLSFLFSCSSIAYFSIPIKKIQNLSRAQFSALGSPSWLRLEENMKLHWLICLWFVTQQPLGLYFGQEGSLHACFLLCTYFISDAVL